MIRKETPSETLVSIERIRPRPRCPRTDFRRMGCFFTAWMHKSLGKEPRKLEQTVVNQFLFKQMHGLLLFLYFTHNRTVVSNRYHLDVYLSFPQNLLIAFNLFERFPFSLSFPRYVDLYISRFVSLFFTSIAFRFVFVSLFYYQNLFLSFVHLIKIYYFHFLLYFFLLSIMLVFILIALYMYVYIYKLL